MNFGIFLYTFLIVALNRLLYSWMLSTFIEWCRSIYEYKTFKFQDRACIFLSDSNWVSLVSPPVFISFLTVDLEHVFDLDSLEYLEALECVTERLENRVNYCKAHLMMITCFDISSRRRWRISLKNLLDYCQTPLSFFLNLYPKDPEWGWRLVPCFDYVREDATFF